MSATDEPVAWPDSPEPADPGRGPKPFHFLVDGRTIQDGRALAETARRAEAIGYHALVVPDHLVPQLSPIAVMATVAAVTERLRVSAFVFNNDLRHPAVLAQELASIDVLSGGRAFVAVGAGWNRPEYDAIGLPFEPVRVRQERLAEAIAVMKGAFGSSRFSFDGRHYTIRDLDGQPKPVQRPHPPFLIGGGGRRTLELAAREAAIVGLAPRIGRGDVRDLGSISIAATAEKIGWVREAAGDRFDDLELNVYPSMASVSVTDHALAEAREVAAWLNGETGESITAEELLESPHIFVGSVESLTEKFLALRETLGISSFMVGEPGPIDAVVERLAGS